MGVKAVITKSYERIHIANLINFGIIPFNFDNPGDLDAIDQGDKLEIDKVRDIIAGDGVAVVKNVTKGTTFTVSTKLSERQKKIILAGGMLNFL
jgi:aconitate hydratase